MEENIASKEENIRKAKLELENLNTQSEVTFNAEDSTLIQSTEEIMQPWSPELVIHLGTMILIFGAVALLIAGILLFKTSVPADLVLKITGLVSIVCMSAFLMVAGYGQDQLTPIIGLFGAIAGYLLGKEPKSSNT